MVFTDYPENTLDTAYTYDDPAVPFLKARLTSIARTSATVDYLYDRFGRITQDGALTYSYDRNSNRTGIGYPQGVSTSCTFDFADREAPFTLDDGTTSHPIVTGASYLPSGPLTRYFPTGISVPGLLALFGHPVSSKRLAAHSSRSPLLGYLGYGQRRISGRVRPSPGKSRCSSRLGEAIGPELRLQRSRPADFRYTPAMFVAFFLVLVAFQPSSAGAAGCSASTERQALELAWSELLKKALERSPEAKSHLENQATSAIEPQLGKLARHLLSEWDRSPTDARVARPALVWRPQIDFTQLSEENPHITAPYVMVEGEVTPEGLLHQPVVLRSSGNQAVDDACLASASEALYRPAVSDGLYVTTRAILEYRLDPQ